MTLLNYADLTGAMTNLVALEKQITVDVGTILGQSFNTSAKAFMRYDSEVYPKWLNGLSTAVPDEFGLAEEYTPYTFSIELQLGKITQGFDGALEQTLYTWIPYTLASFDATPRLQTDAVPTIPRFLLMTNLRTAQPRMPGDIIAAQFILTLAFSVQNYERY